MTTSKVQGTLDPGLARKAISEKKPNCLNPKCFMYPSTKIIAHFLIVLLKSYLDNSTYLGKMSFAHIYLALVTPVINTTSRRIQNVS